MLLFGPHFHPAWVKDLSIICQSGLPWKVKPARPGFCGIEPDGGSTSMKVMWPPVWWSCPPKSPVPFLHILVLKIRIAIFFYNSHSCLLFLKVMWLKALKGAQFNKDSSVFSANMSRKLFTKLQSQMKQSKILERTAVDRILGCKRHRQSKWEMTWQIHMLQWWSK